MLALRHRRTNEKRAADRVRARFAARDDGASLDAPTVNQAASASPPSAVGPESLPLAETSRSTNSMTPTGAESP